MELSVLPFPYKPYSSFLCSSSSPILLILRFPRSPYLRSIPLQFSSPSSQKQAMLTAVNLPLTAVSCRRGEAPLSTYPAASHPPLFCCLFCQLRVSESPVLLQRHSVNVVLLSCHMVTFIQRYFITCKAC